jgi:hypothetical protein
VVQSETDLAVRKESRLRPDLGFFSAKTWATVDLTKVPMQRKIEAYSNGAYMKSGSSPRRSTPSSSTHLPARSAYPEGHV